MAYYLLTAEVKQNPGETVIKNIFHNSDDSKSIYVVFTWKRLLHNKIEVYVTRYIRSCSAFVDLLFKFS